MAIIESRKASIDHLDDLEISTINVECDEHWRIQECVHFQKEIHVLSSSAPVLSENRPNHMSA
jgi:hypothetical protein